MDVIISFFAFLIVIAVLITLHEWGHFSVARWLNVKVLQFSIGFGKPLLRWHGRSGIEYRIAIFPVGGYVKLVDEQEGPVAWKDQPYAFNRQRPWKRMLITAAGPAYNFLFAFIAYWVLFCVGMETPVIPSIPPIVGSVISGGPAALSGLMKGDTVRVVNDHPVADWQAFVDFIRAHPHQDLLIRVERNKRPVTLQVHTDAQEDEAGKEIGYLGIVSEQFKPTQWKKEAAYLPWEAVKPAFLRTVEVGKLTLHALAKMVRGKMSLGNISGPIGIAQGAGASLSLGWKPYLEYLAVISISLGILNFLPIPVLDGGRFMYYFIEAVFRRPLPQIIQDIGMRLGVLFLMALLLLAFYNDLSRLF